MDYTPLLVTRELRRIGVDLSQLQGLASSGPRPQDVLRWLRSLPTGLGHDEFMRRLKEVSKEGPPHFGIVPDLQPADPNYVDPECDELLALMLEIDRVVPRSERGGFGVNFPHGRAAALAALRKLPDAAGAAAAVRAVEGDRTPVSDPGA